MNNDFNSKIKPPHWLTMKSISLQEIEQRIAKTADSEYRTYLSSTLLKASKYAGKLKQTLHDIQFSESNGLIFPFGEAGYNGHSYGIGLLKQFKKGGVK